MTTYPRGRVVLNWDDPAHWSERMRPCRCCTTLTHGRDERGMPCHKSCEVAELGAELAAAVGGVR